MIDTVRIAVYREFNSAFYELLLLKSKQHQNGFFVNRTTGLMQATRVFNVQVATYEHLDNDGILNKKENIKVDGTILIPSHDYKINFVVFIDRVVIEFSIPKFIYGTNVIELRNHYYLYKDLNPYQYLVKSLKKFFFDLFPNIKITYGGIKILRWDFCFNQVYKDKQQALEALHYMKLKHSKKSDTKNYEYGIVEISKTEYFKIYYKGEEFKKHPPIKHHLPIEQLQNFADCILRYERQIKPKNITYFYRTKYEYKNQPYLVQDYVTAKKNNKLTNEHKKYFEKIQHFTLGKSLIYDATKLQEEFFNQVYFNFLAENKKRFKIGRSTTSILQKTVTQKETKNKTMKIRILAIIKTFSSLKRAFENKAISESTYYRYQSFLDKENLSQTKVKIDIPQDFTHKNYLDYIRKNNINISSLSKSLEY